MKPWMMVLSWALPACQIAPPAPSDAPPSEQPAEAPSVKPHFVKCDPTRPELPCTPDPLRKRPAPPATPPGVKPHFVKCDPTRPELPCTPDPLRRLPAPPATPAGVKPHYVKCDPARPELPCTPELSQAPEDVQPEAEVPVARLATGRSEAELRGCTVDADCVVTCRVDGDCCAEVCGCRAVYNRTFSAALDAHQRAACSGAVCSDVKCAEHGPALTGACVEQRCVTRHVTP